MKTKVVHSQTKTAWNIVGTIPGHTYKLARIPYYVIPDFKNDDPINQAERKRAYKLAVSISKFLNTATSEPSDQSELVIPVDELRRMFKDGGTTNTTSEKRGY